MIIKSALLFATIFFADGRIESRAVPVQDYTCDSAEVRETSRAITKGYVQGIEKGYLKDFYFQCTDVEINFEGGDPV